MGYSVKNGIYGLLSHFFGKKIELMSAKTLEQQRFEADVLNQLLELKKMGLSIPVFTL
jgi:hypothetical protein